MKWTNKLIAFPGNAFTENSEKSVNCQIALYRPFYPCLNQMQKQQTWQTQPSKWGWNGEPSCQTLSPPPPPTALQKGGNPAEMWSNGSSQQGQCHRRKLKTERQTVKVTAVKVIFINWQLSPREQCTQNLFNFSLWKKKTFEVRVKMDFFSTLNARQGWRDCWCKMNPCGCICDGIFRSKKEDGIDGLRGGSLKWVVSP